MPTLAVNGSQIGIGLLIVLFLFISVLMVLVVLIQRPQGGGLSGAFGASSEGAGQTAFGAKVGDALTTATILIFVLFLGAAIALNLLIGPPKDRPPGVKAAPTQGAGEQTTDQSQPDTAPPASESNPTTPPPSPSSSTDTSAPQTPAPETPTP